MLERITGYNTAYYTLLINNMAVLAALDDMPRSKKRKRNFVR